MCQCPARYARNVKLVSQKNRRQRTTHVTSYKQMCPTLGFATKARLDPTETKKISKKKFHKDDKVSATTVFDSKPRSNLTTLLDLCVHNISILQFHVCLKRVRINRILEISHSILEISHSILEISLPEQVRLKHVVDTN